MPDDTRSTGAEIDIEASPGQQSRAKGTRRRGAQPGNTNHLQAGLLAQQGEAAQRRKALGKAAQQEVNALLVSLGLHENPLAQRIARRMVSAEIEIAMLEKHVEQRGRFDSKGQPRKAYEMLVDVTKNDLEGCRRMLDALAEVVAGTPRDNSETLYVVEYADGQLALGSEAQRRQLLELARAGTPLKVETHVCSYTGDAGELSGRPHAPGDPLPRDLDPLLGAHAPAQGDLSAGETGFTSASTGPLLGARGTANAKSLDRKVGRAIRSRPDDDPGVQRPAAVPEDAIFDGQSWVWKRGDQTWMVPVAERDTWHTVGQW